MTIHQTAYTTSACSGQVLHKISDGIAKAWAMGYVNALPESSSGKICGLASDYAAGHGDIPAFYHPFIFERDGMKRIIVDDRQFVRYGQSDHARHISNSVEYDVMLMRAKIQLAWISKLPAFLRDLSPVPASIYVSWVSEAVQRVYALDPFEQMKFSILVGIFYYSLFSDAVQEEEREWVRLATKVAEAVRCKADEVFEIIDKLEKRAPKDLAELCTKAAEVIESVRLKDLNAGMLMSSIGNGWFGSNVREMLAVALEHPPTWFALIVIAHRDRSYRRTTIATIVSRQRLQALDQFSNAVIHATLQVEQMD